MTPSLAIPTDNIYKFVCLFGLALVIAAVVSFVTTYTATLDQKVKYYETVISLEARQPRSKIEEDTLILNRRLLDVTQENGKFANLAISALCGVGLALSVLGALAWHKHVQLRDDRLVGLQIQKLELEVESLRSNSSKVLTATPAEKVIGEGDG